MVLFISTATWQHCFANSLTNVLTIDCKSAEKWLAYLRQAADLWHIILRER